MNPSYCRIRTQKDDALQRVAAWQGIPQIGPLVATSGTDAVGLACDDQGRWRGNAVLVSDVPGWTLFQDLSGGLSAIPASEWLRFAKVDQLVFAGYNDAIGYGELIAISDGVVLREFLEDSSSPDANVNRGQLDDGHEPFKTWIEIASFVDDDELGFSDEGFLWIYPSHQ
jgi:hypothetical protein